MGEERKPVSSDELIRRAKESLSRPVLRSGEESRRGDADAVEDGRSSSDGRRHARDSARSVIGGRSRTQTVDPVVREAPVLVRSGGRFSRTLAWMIPVAMAIGLGAFVVMSSDTTESSPQVETASSPEVEVVVTEVAAQSNLAGFWVIRYGDGATFTFELQPGGVAIKNGRGLGTWESVDGEALIVWRDGWRDKIRPKPGTTDFENDAFRPGTTFTDRAANTATAVLRQSDSS